MHVACAFALALCSGLSHAGSLRFCDATTEPGAAAQDRLLRVAGVVKNLLEQSGLSVALVARSGLALQLFDQRYSHAGVSLRASGNASWSVRQLYFACDEQRPRIFDQGMPGFVLGVQDAAEGYITLLLLPPEAAKAVEHVALDNARALELLAPQYSVNAYSFSTRYQNCNQWLVELLAHAWAGAVNDNDAGDIVALPMPARARAQTWLQHQQFEPTVMSVGWAPLMWLANAIPWVHSDDHPPADLAARHFRVSMPESIEHWVRVRLPETTRIELCYTAKQVVVHRGWTSIASGCTPSEGDTVIALTP